MTTLTDLTRAALAHLAGRPIKVRLRPPATQGAQAAIYKTAGGLLVDIDPTQPRLDYLYSVAHEAAHARLHDIPSSTGKFANLAPGELKLTAAGRATAGSQPRETEADSLARRWVTYALKQCPSGDLLDCLQALAAMPYPGGFTTEPNKKVIFER